MSMGNFTFSIQQLFDALGNDDATKMEIIDARPRLSFSHNSETGELIIANCDSVLKEKLEMTWQNWRD